MLANMVKIDCQGAVDPVQTVVGMAGAFAVPRCLHVVADLGVADALGESPRTAADLAALVHADADALGRVLRLLAAYGLFESRGDAFAHTPASLLLQTDHPQSLRAFVRMLDPSRSGTPNAPWSALCVGVTQGRRDA